MLGDLLKMVTRICTILIEMPSIQRVQGPDTRIAGVERVNFSGHIFVSIT